MCVCFLFCLKVRRRRASRELAHPAPQPEEADDTELLATIKPPKSRFEVKALSDQLSAMSAQVATARSGVPDTGRSSHPDLHGPPPPAARALSKPMQALSEEPPPPSANVELPPSRFAGGGYPGPSAAAARVPAAAAAAPAYVPAAAPPARQQASPPPLEDPLPQGWKQVRASPAASSPSPRGMPPLLCAARSDTSALVRATRCRRSRGRGRFPT